MTGTAHQYEIQWQSTEERAEQLPAKTHIQHQYGRTFSKRTHLFSLCYLKQHLISLLIASKLFLMASEPSMLCIKLCWTRPSYLSLLLVNVSASFCRQGFWQAVVCLLLSFPSKTCSRISCDVDDFVLLQIHRWQLRQAECDVTVADCSVTHFNCTHLRVLYVENVGL